jgi:hypothetical protein
MTQALVQFHEHRGRHKATKSVASIVEVMHFNAQAVCDGEQDIGKQRANDLSDLRAAATLIWEARHTQSARDSVRFFRSSRSSISSG